MSLISECRTLRSQAWVANHEQVTILLTVNRDFASLIKQYEQLVCWLVKADSIVYYPTMQWDGEWESISTMLYDMKIGIQTHTPQLNRKDHLAKLQIELVDEQRFVIDLKRSLSNPEFIDRAPEHIVAIKRTKLIELNTKIEQMQIEIETLKMKNK